MLAVAIVVMVYVVRMGLTVRKKNLCIFVPFPGVRKLSRLWKQNEICSWHYELLNEFPNPNLT